MKLLLWHMRIALKKIHPKNRNGNWMKSIITQGYLHISRKPLQLHISYYQKDLFAFSQIWLKPRHKNWPISSKKPMMENLHPSQSTLTWKRRWKRRLYPEESKLWQNLSHYSFKLIPVPRRRRNLHQAQAHQSLLHLRCSARRSVQKHLRWN